MENKKSTVNKWFHLNPIKDHSGEVRIFCFPFAGGSASIYSGWYKKLPDFVDVYAVQYPGRADRFLEEPYEDMAKIVSQLVTLMRNFLDKPFIFLGYSMGAKIAFEVMNRLAELGLRLPEHFIALACRAPHLPLKRKKIHNLDDDLFIKELKNFGGTPCEVLKNRELMSLVIPTLRSDFKLFENYQYKGNRKFDCLISIVGGNKDTDISIDDLKSWALHFNQAPCIEVLDGDHFFINSHRDDLLSIISGFLLGTVVET